ncbi:hypothetical protein C8R47DRAFT_1214510 [Mycena vitilis]|nr:hypothetical protein C8R47DRAFT_1214510 [Mycena vitilis]
MFQKTPAPRRAVRLQRRPSHPFWDTGDLVLYMLRWLCLVDLIRFSHINPNCRAYMRVYLKGRIARYVSLFLTPSVLVGPPSTLTPAVFKSFFFTLRLTGSWIVGSVALAAASVLSDAPPPDNLNIIAPNRAFHVWEPFLRRWGYELMKRVWPSGPYGKAAQVMLVFQHILLPERKITLTIAHGANIGALFFASPNTDQLVAIASHELITPVLENVSQQQHLKGCRPHHYRHPLLGLRPDEDPIPRGYRDEPRFPGITTLDATPEKWTRPCGKSCPGVCRSARGLDGIARVMWGGLSGIEVPTDKSLLVLGESRLTYRFGTGPCINKKCTESDLYESDCEDADGADDNYQREIARAIREHEPPYAATYTALLFPVGSSGPTYVPVPVRLGLQQAASPDHLDVTIWVPLRRQMHTSSIDLHATRIAVDRWPLQSPTPLGKTFTVCVAQQLGTADVYTETDPQAINSHFEAENRGSWTPVRGNVLIIKEENSGLADITQDDEDIATSIAKSVIEENLFRVPTI